MKVHGAHHIFPPLFHGQTIYCDFPLASLDNELLLNSEEVGREWPGGIKVLGKLSVPGLPTNVDISRQGPIALTIGAGGGCLDIFSFIYLFSFLFPSLGDSPIKTEILCQRAVNPKEPTNQSKSESALRGHSYKSRFLDAPRRSFLFSLTPI